MLTWLFILLALLIVSGALMVVGTSKSAQANGGLGKGRLFDRVARRWTVPALVLLAGVVIGCVVLFS